MIPHRKEGSQRLPCWDAQASKTSPSIEKATLLGPTAHAPMAQGRLEASQMAGAEKALLQGPAVASCPGRVGRSHLSGVGSGHRVATRGFLAPLQNGKNFVPLTDRQTDQHSPSGRDVPCQ